MAMENIHRKQYQRQQQATNRSYTPHKTRNLTPGSKKRKGDADDCNQKERNRPIQCHRAVSAHDWFFYKDLDHRENDFEPRIHPQNLQGFTSETQGNAETNDCETRATRHRQIANHWLAVFSKKTPASTGKQAMHPARPARFSSGISHTSAPPSGPGKHCISFQNTPSGRTDHR